MNQKNNINIFTPVLIGGSLILLISFAIRSTFGLFQIPIADEFMWARSEFSMAIAIQNLAWGIGTPIFSAFAEKFGDRKAITLGLILYAIGVFISSSASSPEAHQFLNILIGFGIAGSGFGPILAVVGRTAAPEKRSLALGITTAAGSAGQVVGPPFAAGLLDIMPWSSVFVIFAIIYKEINNNNLKSFSNEKKMSMFDAFYFSAITHTTVGFGDISPETKYAKLSSMIHVLLVFFIGFLEINQII